MKSKAILMALAMMTTALAGCTGTDGVTEVDEDALNELIDANLQDFINNTTIVVNNHYHNNTTVNNNHYDTTNEYNNTTNVDGGEVNNHNTDNSVNHYNGSGSGTGSTMQMFTVDWDFQEYLGYDPSEVIITGGSSNNQSGPSGSGTLLYVDFYNGQMVEFRDVSCEDWMNYRQFDEDDWEYWLDDNYGTDWNEREDVARDIYDHYRQNDQDQGYGAYEQCGIYTSYLGINQYDPNSRVILYEVELGVGQAMSYLVTTPYVTVDVNCDDGYGTGLGNGTSTGLIGGQANCTVTGSTLPYWRLAQAECKTDENGECLRNHDGWNARTLYHYGIYLTGTAPSSFAVYFTMHEVVVYDLGNE